MQEKIVINPSWSLFLDRDGVINQRLPGDYIKDWSQFQFTEGTTDAIAQFSKWFDLIFVVTNQQGIGKGLMTSIQLEDIHQRMLQVIKQHQGKIDQIYYCPDLKSKSHNCRKPNPAMGLQAKADFPKIAFHKSIMVGDSISDIEFGHNLGMITVLVEGKTEEAELIQQLPTKLQPHYQIKRLKDLVQLLEFTLQS